MSCWDHTTFSGPASAAESPPGPIRGTVILIARPGPAGMSRRRATVTYHGSHHGCQMNVHDSRTADLGPAGNDAGYRRRRRRGRRRPWSSSTRARCVRTRTTNSTAACRTWRRSERGKPGMQIARWADAWRRTVRRSRSCALHWTWCLRNATTSVRCRCCWTVPATTAHGAGRDHRGAAGVSPALPAARESAYAALGFHLGRLQQHLYFLHQPMLRGKRVGPQARRHPG